MKHLFTKFSILSLFLGFILFVSCSESPEEEIPEPCVNPPLITSITTIAASSDSIHDGSLSIEINKKSGIEFSIDDKNFISNSSFDKLSAKSYTVIIKDKNGCSDQKITKIEIATQCENPTKIDNIISTPATSSETKDGKIIVKTNPTILNLSYSIDGKTYQKNNTFENLSAENYTVSVKNEKGCISIKKTMLESLISCEKAPKILNLEISSSSTKEDNGSIIIKTEATLSLTYSIDGTTFQESNTFTGLSAGSYHITVKDENGCLAERTMNLNAVEDPCLDSPVITNILATATSTPNKSDGSLTVSTDRTEGISYSIGGIEFQQTNTFTGLSAASYLIKIKDENGCFAEKSATIEALDPCKNPPVITNIDTKTATSSKHSNGILTISTNRTEGITYSIDGRNFVQDNSFTDLPPGTYTIYIKDENDCSTKKDATIEALDPCENPPVITNINTSPSSSSKNSDGSLTISTNRTQAISYSINGINFVQNNSFTGLASGDYLIRIRDENGCSAKKQAKINALDPCQNPPQITNISTTPTSSPKNSNGSLTVTTNRASGISYTIDGNNFYQSNTFTGLSAKTYTVRIKDLNNCTSQKRATINALDPCVTSPIQITRVNKTKATAPRNKDGSLTISTNRSSGVSYSINGRAYVQSNIFTGLLAGSYIIRAKDINGCMTQKTETVEALDPCVTSPIQITNIAVTPSSFANTNDGSLSISTNRSSGVSYSIDGLSFTQNNTFTALSPKSYTIKVKDRNDCSIEKTAVVTSTNNTNLPSYNNQVKSILTANCNGCHGSFANTKLNTFANIKANASKIKTQVVNKYMPIGAPLTDEQIKIISDWIDAGAPNN